MEFWQEYIDPEISILKTRKGGKGMKMSNKVTTQEAKAPKARYSKTRGEHYKDIIIAVLIAGIIAFIGGMHFSNSQHSQVTTAVKAALAPTVSAQASK